MSIDHLQPQNSASGPSIDYASLQREGLEAGYPTELIKPAERDPSLEDYEGTAARIRKTADFYQAKQMPFKEAIPDLKDIYCHDEDNQTQKAFNELMIDTIVMRHYQVMLDRLKEVPLLDEKQRHAQEQLKYRRCEFNHVARDVIAAGRGVFDRPMISSFIAAAGGGTQSAQEFSRRVVNGAAAELAVMDALSGMPEVSFAQFTDVELDLKGVDIKMATDKGWASVDVKAADGPSVPGWRNGQPRIEFHLDQSRLEELSASPSLLKSLRSELAQSLDVSYSLQAVNSSK